MDTAPVRRPSEAVDLVSHVVVLRRRGAPRVTVLAATDQARRSLDHETHQAVRTTLTGILRALESGLDEGPRLDAALRLADRDVRRGPSAGTVT
ncbi:hypothetical protein [Actinomycetospora straminea]|uniref:Prevent-host-death family protein n=1 Tax=Actinomycetospora straminea TaxID=663607 RepID=A0ABP9EJC0_9PSEU|nr:hypothetical protein [Actinomycetospora straminea]MDD7933224.1 hypothetical protein [Actinomycetospora straminea]